MKYIFIAGFVLMVAAQWYAPLSMIMSAETTIDDGTEYRFKTRPIDPTDPFRGKYITLDYDAETYNSNTGGELGFEQGTEVFAIIEEDPEGFARVNKLTTEMPQVDYFIKVQFNYSYDSTASLSFPFKRFYLEESKASEAEQLYWNSRFDSAMVCYAKVRVLRGDAKLVDVMVNDTSIVDVVRRINAGKGD